LIWQSARNRGDGGLEIETFVFSRTDYQVPLVHIKIGLRDVRIHADASHLVSHGRFAMMQDKNNPVI
jgi:hypothetical protein